jgi:hypothetical protein
VVDPALRPDRWTRDLPPRGPRDQARAWFARSLEHVPRLYVAWAAHHAWSGTEYSPDTDLVIEGFPGSGNSYFRAWLHFANWGTHLTSHQHSPAVLRRAIADDRPTVVLARDPVEAIASTLLRFPERWRRPDGPRHLFARYPRVYAPVLRRPEAVVVATFDQISGPGAAAVVDRVNDRFGTAFHPLPLGYDDQVMTYLASLENEHGGAPFHGSAPDEERKAAARDVADHLRGPQYRQGRAAAERTYDALRQLAGEAP